MGHSHLTQAWRVLSIEIAEYYAQCRKKNALSRWRHHSMPELLNSGTHHQGIRPSKNQVDSGLS
jgi:hypothetical protein